VTRLDAIGGCLLGPLWEPSGPCPLPPPLPTHPVIVAGSCAVSHVERERVGNGTQRAMAMVVGQVAEKARVDSAWRANSSPGCLRPPRVCHETTLQRPWTCLRKFNNPNPNPPPGHGVHDADNHLLAPKAMVARRACNASWAGKPSWSSRVTLIDKRNMSFLPELTQAESRQAEEISTHTNDVTEPQTHPCVDINP
jgi:hypothetical protein